MGSQGRHHPALFSIFAWALNITSSVGVIFANKYLMGAEHLNFHFSTTLSGLHYLLSACVTLLMAKSGVIASSGKALSRRDLFWFIAYASLSIICLNLSLVVNDMGFYQLMKLTVVPYVALVEVIWRGKRYTLAQTLSMLLVVSGVGVVTVTGIEVKSPLGLLAAIGATIGSGMQQIYCAMLQKQYGMSSMDLLQATMWTLGSLLIGIGPLTDRMFYGDWVIDFTYTKIVMLMLLVSCAFAVAVNLSQFMVLGRFSAITYTTMGHSKTLLVLLGAFCVFGETLTGKKIFGMTTAVSGMLAYAYFSMTAPKP